MKDQTYLRRSRIDRGKGRKRKKKVVMFQFQYAKQSVDGKIPFFELMYEDGQKVATAEGYIKDHVDVPKRLYGTPFRNLFHETFKSLRRILHVHEVNFDDATYCDALIMKSRDSNLGVQHIKSGRDMGNWLAYQHADLYSKVS